MNYKKYGEIYGRLSNNQQEAFDELLVSLGEEKKENTRLADWVRNTPPEDARLKFLWTDVPKKYLTENPERFYFEHVVAWHSFVVKAHESSLFPKEYPKKLLKEIHKIFKEHNLDFKIGIPFEIECLIEETALKMIRDAV
ncbi:MAG: hypothetical protein LBO09_08035 [Candidatus Peribacteria bacterium]|jgi:hypothetical protein|nr:hypothetical protein [Candidatus Peribacteria bacterium]